ncbi:hypothetical protein QBC38DRAFT_517297 [Podospora fimiseda]|uniref:Uncharacterized protein n=1 Tax=Podospora fimiseda TaxID=252190 RepID=A0AAN7GWL8_9PEZI|nr:hypothetical protein QBC38DRAFT_517297 [Podospora fimiseda]
MEKNGRSLQSTIRDDDLKNAPLHPLTDGEYQFPPFPDPKYLGDKPYLVDGFGNEPFGVGFSPGNETAEFNTHKSAKMIVNTLKEDMSTAGLEFVKILGFGGNGLACLFEKDLPTKEGGMAKHRWVVKTCLDDGLDKQSAQVMRAEANWMRKFQGDIHIVQLKPLPLKAEQKIIFQDIEYPQLKREREEQEKEKKDAEEKVLQKLQAEEAEKEAEKQAEKQAQLEAEEAEAEGEGNPPTSLEAARSVAGLMAPVTALVLGLGNLGESLLYKPFECKSWGLVVL